MSSPLIDSLLAATAWFEIAVLSLIPPGDEFFVREFAFSSGTLAGLALAAFGLSRVMILCASADAHGIFPLAPDSGAQPGMKIK